MKDNLLTVLVHQSACDKPITIRAFSREMLNIQFMRVILESDTRPPRAFTVKECRVVVENLHPILPDTAEYTFHITKMEPRKEPAKSTLAFMKNNGRYHTRHIANPIMMHDKVEFTYEYVSVKENPNNWVQHERFRDFTCKQLLDEIERRRLECLSHRPLYDSKSTPITDLEWAEYDRRHTEEE
ncbi:hypothetical protein pEaSNUABM5_00265 [Erwinia phage pEa_SNUABM_5]|uniref:Uncharacterized protein n=1 Tax=Erwinia phage pEa_SNUABM_5 TaxID=2797313 RepID=A0A7T8IW52_9CAUD|nr:hypothetical protein MPK73_gp265 [Erwinia phage pEa_SNUABM_5]QQO90407.1 hypothetical protein pEaSNUABM5_00265 [Erwinia phage pEa_SNUABM_5]